ncbi:hypothetical protein MB02_16665 [Croceicoccus estronivorus]|uniref:acyl-CoA dehydrogenase family protein n=1 Tax=Croceicoccus estronivorus TaxID=1172626 RepID=UPI00082D9A32|nr:acyl-CoA dehydrogenase family protein [Croceicoccus estronivorus]OCC22490.1 hypothetical protein MB02_16665 [Croceicoccus estronivorus]
MQFTFSEDETLLQQSVAGFCTTHGSSASTRKVMETEAGYDSALWRAVMGEMGLGGIALPARHGGAEMGHVGLAIAMMEMGRVLLPSPYFSSVGMAAQAILLGGTDAQRDALLPSIATGECIAALAWRGAGRGHEPDVRLDDALRLNGVAGFVPFGHVADLLVVAARRESGEIVLVAVRANTPGVTIERHVSLDLTRPLATVRFAGVVLSQDDILGSGEDAAAALARTLDLARIALAAEQAGGAEAVLDMTVAYTKDRVQFGRPIGSFQALKHRMADMMVEVETAKTGAYYAACIVDEGSDELEEAAAIAASYCGEAFMGCSGNAIQLHGGIGFTWEHDAHLYFKRARADAMLLGDAYSQRERIAGMIGLEKVA